MSDLRAAAQALVAFCDGPPDAQRPDVWQRLLNNLRAALSEQPAHTNHGRNYDRTCPACNEPEPVATVVARQYDDGTYAGNMLDWASRNCEDDLPVGTKLYTAPPRREPLTPGEITTIYQLYGTGRAEGFYAAVREVERAHKIGEKP